MRKLELFPNGAVPNAQPIPLYRSKIWAETAEDMRSIDWSYDLQPHRIWSIARISREVTLKVKSTSQDALDEAESMFDAHMEMEAPMDLCLTDGVGDVWTAKVFIPKVETDSVTPTVISQSWTVVIIDVVWRHKGATVPNGGSYDPPKPDDKPTQQGDDLDLPTDFPFDLTGPSSNGSSSYIYTNQHTVGGSNFEMAIYGPCTDPIITISGNSYEVKGTFEAGSYITVNSVDRTITLTDSTGKITNIFEKGVRGAGRGSGSYIFERIPANNPRASASGSFSYTITLIEEKSDPSFLVGDLQHDDSRRGA